MKHGTPSRIIVAGSAANPVTLGHREVAETLTHSGLADLVLWVPSGTRPDKPSLIDATHRVRMTELTFDDAWRESQPAAFRIDLRDAFRENTPTIYLLEELQKEYPNATLIFATGVDVLIPKDTLGGKCEVHLWDEGERLMSDWIFAALPRGGYPDPRLLQAAGHLPQHFLVPDMIRDQRYAHISSTEVRKRALAGESFHDLVSPQVATYIQQHNLYK